MTHNALSKSILCFLFFIALTGCGQSTTNSEHATSVTPASDNEKNDSEKAIANSGAVNLYSARHYDNDPVSYTHLRAHETREDLVCRLLLEKKKKT